MQDTSDSLAYGNSQLSFGNVGGLATPTLDLTRPSRYRRCYTNSLPAANGSGSGTSYNDVGATAGQMGIGAKFDVPFLGAVNYKYYPKTDGVKNADNANSSDENANVGDAFALTVKTNLADLPGAGALAIYFNNWLLRTRSLCNCKRRQRI